MTAASVYVLPARRRRNPRIAIAAALRLAVLAQDRAAYRALAEAAVRLDRGRSRQ